MAEQIQWGNHARLSDASQQNVYGIATGAALNYSQSERFATEVDEALKRILLDQEVANLLIWLAKEQGVTPEVAFKKAVVTAAYIHDVTAGQGGRLLVQRKDNSVGEIILK